MGYEHPSWQERNRKKYLMCVILNIFDDNILQGGALLF